MSAKCLDPDNDPDHNQNQTIRFLYHCQYFLEYSSTSIHNFMSYFANRQTHAITNITSLVEEIIPVNWHVSQFNKSQSLKYRGCIHKTDQVQLVPKISSSLQLFILNLS